jgi:hypothetical protein
MHASGKQETAYGESAQDEAEWHANGISGSRDARSVMPYCAFGHDDSSAFSAEPHQSTGTGAIGAAVNPLASHSVRHAPTVEDGAAEKRLQSIRSLKTLLGRAGAHQGGLPQAITCARSRPTSAGLRDVPRGPLSRHSRRLAISLTGRVSVRHAEA